jgi:hypothetical protein
VGVKVLVSALALKLLLANLNRLDCQKLGMWYLEVSMALKNL